MAHTLQELARSFSLGFKGDANTSIQGLCGLDPGRENCLTFLANPRLCALLDKTKASAVVMTVKQAEQFSGNALIASDPQLTFARIAVLFDRHGDSQVDAIHPTAVIAEDAQIGEGCFIGPHCVVGQGAKIGAGTRLVSQVFVWHGVRIGARCNVQPGAVIGARGFGNVPSAAGWVEMPQLGSVVIGDDVEIGANTCIDRGALEDTIIGSGVKIDNLVQIAHNVQIGAHTAIAACVGIAGSTQIGARCMIGGAVGINGHLLIGDDVVIMAGAMVTKSLPGKAQYSGVIPAEPAREWRKTVARLRRLEALQARVTALEKQMGKTSVQDSGEFRDDDP